MLQETICTSTCKECEHSGLLVGKFLGLEKYYCKIKMEYVLDIESRFCEDFLRGTKKCDKKQKNLK